MKLRNLFLGAFLFALNISTAHATLFGTIGTSGSSDLVEVDPTTGQIVNTIGSIGYAINGLTYDSTTDTLYGSARSTGGLIEIDRNSGSGTLIGSGWNGIVTNITTNSLGQMFGWTESSDDLVSINKLTGVETVIGNAGFFTATYGLAFDSNDVLHLLNGGTNTHYTINTATGSGTSTGSIDTAALGDFDLSTNLYYGLSKGGNCSGLCDGSMVIMDVTTNTIVDSYASAGLHTLAFVDSVSVPEPSVFALLGLGLLGIGFTRRKVVA